MLVKIPFITHYSGDTQRSTTIRSRYCTSDTMVDIPEMSRSDFAVGAIIEHEELLHREGDFWKLANPFATTPINEMSDDDLANLFDGMTERSFMDHTRIDPTAVALPGQRYAPGRSVKYDQRDDIEAMIQHHFAENVVVVDGRPMTRALPPFISAIPQNDEGRWYYTLTWGDSLAFRPNASFALSLYPDAEMIAETTGLRPSKHNSSSGVCERLAQMEIFQQGGYDRLPKFTMQVLADDVHSRLERIKFYDHVPSAAITSLIKEIRGRLYLPLPKVDEQVVDCLHDTCEEALTSFGTYLYPEWQLGVVRRVLSDWQERPLEALPVRLTASPPSL